MTAASTSSSVTPGTSSSTAPAVGVVPLEVERGVDVAQHGAHARAVADDDRRAEQRAPRTSRWAVPISFTRPRALTL